jgi:hypothetical protein
MQSILAAFKLSVLNHRAVTRAALWRIMDIFLNEFVGETTE